MGKNRAVSQKSHIVSTRPLPGSYQPASTLLRYVVVPASAKRSDFETRGDWMAAGRDALVKTRSEIERALDLVGLRNQIIFEDQLEIGALVLSTTPDVADVIRELPTVDMILQDGLM